MIAGHDDGPPVLAVAAIGFGELAVLSSLIALFRLVLFG